MPASSDGRPRSGAATSPDLSLPPLPAAVDVAVVIPARNSEATLGAAVASALDQDLGEQARALTVTIAVGPSQDATQAVADRLTADDPRVTVVGNPSGATPTALNAAIDASGGEVVLRLDAHAVLPPGYAARAVEVLRATGAANVGGMQVPTADAGFARAVAAAMRSPVGAGGATYRVGGEPGPAETVYLGVFRRAALETVGGFDPTLLRNQDFELNHRLREAGLIVWFDPALQVAYRPRGSAAALWRQYHDYGRWKRAVLRRHPGSLKARQLAPPTLVLGLVAAAAAGPAWSWWPLTAAAGAWLGGCLAEGLRVARPRTDGPSVALALATMHLAWGAGFLRGGITVGGTA